MADGKLVTMKDVDQDIQKKPSVLNAQDAPERLGSIILAGPMRVPTRWSPTRSRRVDLRATSPIKTGHLYYVKESEIVADAWPLITHDVVDDQYIEISKRYNMFVTNGFKSKTGVNEQPAEDEIVKNRFQDIYMPSIHKLEHTKRLQDSVFYENNKVNKINPKPLRQFGLQDRPHHVPKTRFIKHAFSGKKS